MEPTLACRVVAFRGSSAVSNSTGETPRISQEHRGIRVSDAAMNSYQPAEVHMCRRPAANFSDRAAATRSIPVWPPASGGDVSHLRLTARPRGRRLAKTDS